MPTYDYRCENCGHAFELFQSMKDDPVKECPSCGEMAVKRLIGAGAGLMFKGSGFYLTDYVKNGNGKTAAAGSASAASTDSSDTSSTGDSSKSNGTAASSTDSGSASTGSSTSGSSEAA